MQAFSLAIVHFVSFKKNIKFVVSVVEKCEVEDGLLMYFGCFVFGPECCQQTKGILCFFENAQSLGVLQLQKLTAFLILKGKFAFHVLTKAKCLFVARGVMLLSVATNV